MKIYTLFSESLISFHIFFISMKKILSGSKLGACHFEDYNVRISPKNS